MVFRMTGNRQHFLKGSLSYQTNNLVFILNDNTHPSTFKIKGKLIYFLKGFIQILQEGVFFCFLFSPFYDGSVHQIFQASLKIGIEIGPSQDGQIQVSVDVQGIFKDNFVLG